MLVKMVGKKNLYLYSWKCKRMHGESSQKNKNSQSRAIQWSSSSSPGLMHKGLCILPQRWLLISAHFAIFTVTAKCNEPKCPSVDRWTMKMCYIFTMEFYSATKKIQISNAKSVVKGTELENVLSDVIKAEQDKDHTSALHLYPIGFPLVVYCSETTSLWAHNSPGGTKVER